MFAWLLFPLLFFLTSSCSTFVAEDVDGLGCGGDDGVVLLQTLAKVVREAASTTSGQAATLSEAGYAAVAALRSDTEMKTFVGRVLAAAGLEVAPENGVAQLNGLLPYYSGSAAVQSLHRLQEELTQASWVRHVATTPAPAPVAGQQAVLLSSSVVQAEGAASTDTTSSQQVVWPEWLTKNLERRAALLGVSEPAEQAKDESTDAPATPVTPVPAVPTVQAERAERTSNNVSHTTTESAWGAPSRSGDTVSVAAATVTRGAVSLAQEVEQSRREVDEARTAAEAAARVEAATRALAEARPRTSADSRPAAVVSSMSAQLVALKEHLAASQRAHELEVAQARSEYKQQILQKEAEIQHTTEMNANAALEITNLTRSIASLRAAASDLHARRQFLQSDLQQMQQQFDTALEFANETFEKDSVQGVEELGVLQELAEEDSQRNVLETKRRRLGEVSSPSLLEISAVTTGAVPAVLLKNMGSTLTDLDKEREAKREMLKEDFALALRELSQHLEALSKEATELQADKTRLRAREGHLHTAVALLQRTCDGLEERCAALRSYATRLSAR